MILPPGLPPLADEKRFRPPEVDESVLPNGLTLQIVRRPGLPLVSILLLVRGGRSDDPPDAPGFSELLAEALEEGTTTRSSAEMFDRLQAAGGDLTAEATADATVISAHGLAPFTPVLVESVADVVRNAAFPRDGVARVKALAREDLETDESEPSFLAGRAMARELYAPHPYGTIAPTRASIRAVTPPRLLAEARRRLRPERSLLVVAGSVDPAAVRLAVASGFGGWAGSGTPPDPVGEAPRTEGRRAILVVDRPGSVQATLMAGAVGVARRDTDAWALALAVTIYGGAFTSRLVQNLRAEKGYAYSPGAVSGWAVRRGAVRTWASVRTAVAAPALSEILREMERMGADEVLAEELERGRRREAGLSLLALQTGSGLARELGELWLSGLGPRALGEAAEALARVTAEDVRRVSRSYLDPSRSAVVAVGDGTKLAKELSSFGPVTRRGARPGARKKKRER